MKSVQDLLPQGGQARLPCALEHGALAAAVLQNSGRFDGSKLTGQGVMRAAAIEA